MKEKIGFENFYALSDTGPLQTKISTLDHSYNPLKGQNTFINILFGIFQSGK